jgi:hypothetical protein
VGGAAVIPKKSASVVLLFEGTILAVLTKCMSSQKVKKVRNDGREKKS